MISRFNAASTKGESTMDIGEDRDSPEITFAPLETDTPAPAETAPQVVPVEEPVGV